MKKKKRTIRWVFTVLFILSAFSCPFNGLVDNDALAKTQKAEQNNDKLLIKQGGKAIGLAVEFTSHSACTHLAKHKGWFEAEGIELRSYNNFITGMALAAAMARGGIDAAYACLIPVINAYANAGLPLKIVSGVHKYGYGMVVNPNKIKTVKDLEKPEIRIGCLRVGSPVDTLLHKMIEDYNLDGKKILQKVRRMSAAKQLMALKSGQLDACLFPEQYPSMAKAAGFEVLISARDLWPKMEGSVLVVMNDLIQQHPQTVEKLVRITCKSTAWINVHPEEASQIITAELNQAEGDIFPTKAVPLITSFELTPDIMYHSLTDGLTCTTDINPEQVQKTIDYLAKLGYIKQGFKAEEILDLRWLEHD